MSTKIYANAKFALRADTLANWETKNPILEKGEPAVVTDGTESEKIKFGDGITRWKNLPYTKGPKGDKGNQGEQGPQGIQGEKGEPGDITNLVQNAGASDTHAISQKGVTELTAPLREGLGDAIYSKSINLFDCNWALKQDAEGNYENIKIAAWLRATGAENTTLNASKNYGYTGYIAIESNTKYTLGFAKYGDKIPTSELPWNSSDVIGVCFYSDADATKCVGYTSDNTFVTPDTTRYIRFNFSLKLGSYQYPNMFENHLMLVKGANLPTNHTAYSQKTLAEALSEELDKKSTAPLSSATIVNFGDSIFANGEISNELANLTGATVHNCAFGGCRMAGHASANYNAFSMYNLATAIANNDYTLQENALTLEVNGKTVDGYFANRLETLKGIDFKNVDIITIAYSTNDYFANIALTNGSEPFSTSVFDGALRYSIETILTAYPNVRIFLLTPTYRFWMNDSGEFTEDSNTKTNKNGKLLSDYANTIKSVALEYNLPVIDNYNIGMNKFTRFVYFPVDKDTGLNTDGTHPNTTGHELIAKHIAKELY